MPSPRWWVFQKLNGISFVNKGRGHCCEHRSGLVLLFVFLSIGLSLLRFNGLFMMVSRAASIAAVKDLALKHRIFSTPVANLKVIASVISLR